MNDINDLDYKEDYDEYRIYSVELVSVGKQDNSVKFSDPNTVKSKVKETKKKVTY